MKPTVNGSGHKAARNGGAMATNPAAGKRQYKGNGRGRGRGKAKQKPKPKSITVRPEIGGKAAVSANWKKLLQTQGTDVNDTAIVEKHRNKESTILERVVKSASRKTKTVAQTTWFEDDLDEAGLASLQETPATTVATEELEYRPAGGADKYLAMDCEMVGVGSNGRTDVLARCSIVNRDGDTVLDSFVSPKERVVDYRTAVSGVRRGDLLKAPSFEQIQTRVAALLKDRVLIGHSVHHDLKVLMLSHPRHLIRDTSKYPPFRALFGGKTPSLRKLSQKLLKRQIQVSEHSSVEDAKATMDVYKTAAKDWEKFFKSKGTQKGTKRHKGKAKF
eukprot:m.97803 g.97803  ORF g.97803 m.97803 type:complete len:332 (+) comp15061_c0_seq2:92-1087(+)